MEILRPTIAGFCLAWLLAAQTPPTFDAVSIHANKSGLRVSREPDTPGRLVFENTTLSRLIQLAYGVQERNIIGPDSLSDLLHSDRYDLTAADLPVMDATGLSGAHGVCLGFAPGRAGGVPDIDIFDAVH